MGGIVIESALTFMEVLHKLRTRQMQELARRHHNNKECNLVLVTARRKKKTINIPTDFISTCSSVYFFKVFGQVLECLSLSLS
eukprot:c57145_g1_i1 orf=2-247(-)